MDDRYRAGALWLRQHDFGRGKGPQSKFIMLLCDCDDAGPVRAAFATSKGKWYPRTDAKPGPGCGCPDESCFRIDPGPTDRCFTCRTFIEFNNTHPVTRMGLEAEEQRGDALFKYRMTGDPLRAILKCALRSEDIEGEDMDRIEAAYKAMAPTKKTTTAPQPSGPPSFVAAHGIVGLKLHFERQCVACQGGVIDVMLTTETKMRGFLAGVHAPPDGFLEEAEEALRAVRESQVAGCTCKRA